MDGQVLSLSNTHGDTHTHIQRHTESVYVHSLKLMLPLFSMMPGLWWHTHLLSATPTPPTLCPLHLLCQSSSYVSLTLALPFPSTGGFIQFVRVGIRTAQDASLSPPPHMLRPFPITPLRDGPVCASGHYGTWWRGPPATAATSRLAQSAAPNQQAPAGRTACMLIDGQL